MGGEETQVARGAERLRGAEGMLGVLGGLGPLASAEFLKTIYETGVGEREQRAPRVLVYSDPTFPDRTESLLAGDAGLLLARLTGALEWFEGAGVSRVVICCLTIHHLLPRVPANLRARVVSLVEVILEDVLRRREPQLMVCTTGARELGLFQSHELWRAASVYVVWPDAADQQLVHEGLIYEVKRNRPVEELLPLLAELLSKYRVDSFIAGCTEIHLLAKSLAAARPGRAGVRCLDPLTLVAQKLAGENA